MKRRRRLAAFTLLEVMVAIAILALSLSAIFSSEAGAAKMAHRSRKMGIATLLARCKMGEIEEQIAVEGLPAVFDSGSDACCEDAEVEGFTCDWEIEPIVLPDNMFGSEDEADPLAALSGTPSAAPGKPDMESLKNIDPKTVLSGGGGGGVDGIASMAMSFAYPVLKPAFEGQIRRATVTIQWKEGSVPHEFDVTQYVVADQPVAPTLSTTPAPGAVPN